MHTIRNAGGIVSLVYMPPQTMTIANASLALHLGYKYSTLLRIVLFHGRETILRYLATHSNKWGKHSHEALIAAARYTHVECVRAILEVGMLARSEHVSVSMSARSEHVSVSIHTDSACPDVTPNGPFVAGVRSTNDALTAAIHTGSQSIIKLLIDARDPSEDDTLPLTYACFTGNAYSARLLLEKCPHSQGILSYLASLTEHNDITELLSEFINSE